MFGAKSQSTMLKIAIVGVVKGCRFCPPSRCAASAFAKAPAGQAGGTDFARAARWLAQTKLAAGERWLAQTKLAAGERWLAQTKLAAGERWLAQTKLAAGERSLASRSGVAPFSISGSVLLAAA